MTSLKNKKWAYGIILLLFASGSYFFYKKNPSPLLPGNGLGKVVREDLIQRVTIAGGIAPFRKTIITAPYNGYVKKLFVKIGDSVKQGDPLVTVTQSLQGSDSTFPLRSPFNGVVVQIQKSEGEFVKEGDPNEFIMRIDDFTKLYVFANAPEIDRIKIKAGQEAIIKCSAILDKSYKGIIRELSLAAREKDQWNRSQVVEFPIKIEIIDKDEKIRPGMSSIVDIITDRKENVLTLRHEYIHRGNDLYFAILNSEEKRPIKVGLQNEESFEVLEGLKEGDLVKQVDFTQTNQAN